MEKFCSEMTAIVVGSSRQNLIRETIAYLDRINIPFEVCEDSYSAVAMMVAAPAGTNLLIVGGFTAFAVENMRIFSLAPKDKKTFFCCIIEKWFDHLQPRAMAAARPGVFFINSVEQIGNVVKQCKGADTAVWQKPVGRDFATRIASLADKFFLTQAEQDALLGVNNNANTKSHAFTE